MDVLPSDSRQPLGGRLRKHLLLWRAGQLKTPQTRASGSVSPQRSNKYPESRKTREMDSSPIQEGVSDSSEESEGQELARTIELGIGTMPDGPQVPMSHATTMARIATILNLSGTDLSSTIGAQRSDQGGSTGFGQPLTSGTPPEGPPEGQSSERSLQRPQRQPAGPPGGQPPQGPPGGPPGGPPQAAAPQQAVQAPHGTDGAKKGQPPTSFDGERSKTNQLITEFQLWWMINSGAEVMNNPFQQITLCLLFIRGPKV